ncbi:enoyl-CoA hydratase/isomerase family protein [Kocuria sp.]|uniref:enoyl-CoA hydratase/isomerase family protein n=1 Tax=Kocuria sp. TaxID=1871328 RepID=UPI0026DD648C|nr:enoyl-CoA hydratase/isomerase family protein [Kocuria sp.]MDO4919174.1 enoyl-CoA hydratase/isomerase family protein [Kocuria sp.]
MKATEESFVRAEIQGHTGLLTLTRDKALNALNRSMYHQLVNALQMWRDDPAITEVVLRSDLPKALCAGGDIKEVRTAALAGHEDEIRDAFGTEYSMNAIIARYPKPYVAMMNGIVMGGGMGLSVHGSHRVVTETTQLAMPETAIGFFTDVGASFFLPRVTRGAGAGIDDDAARRESLAVARYLGLGGVRITGADAIALGLADTYIDSSDADAFVDAVLADGVDAAVQRFAREAPESEVLGRWDEIVATYSGNTLEQVMESAGSELEGMSPTSLARVFELLDRGAEDDDVVSCLERELRMAEDTAVGHDFIEGVRAVMVDKDKDPHWDPETVAEVDQDRIRAVADQKSELPIRV